MSLMMMHVLLVWLLCWILSWLLYHLYDRYLDVLELGYYVGLGHPFLDVRPPCLDLHLGPHVPFTIVPLVPP